MQNEFSTNSKDEKSAMEKWIQQTYGSNQHLQTDALPLILYKLHLLEEKIDRIENHTKTHWVKD